jgi:hypothetical protein
MNLHNRGSKVCREVAIVLKDRVRLLILARVRIPDASPPDEDFHMMASRLPGSPLMPSRPPQTLPKHLSATVPASVVISCG